MPQHIALTFDDGPHPAGTRQTLEALDVRAIKATFFVWGEQAQQHPDVVREMLSRGHSVQPHCWAHTSHHKMSLNSIRADIDHVLTLLIELGVPAPHLWRTPFGHVRARVTAAVAAERGLELAGWTIDSTDYAGASASDMYEKVTRELAAEPDGPATILMHDSCVEPIQNQSRASVGETVELVRRLAADEDYTFGLLTRGLRDGLDERGRCHRVRIPGLRWRKVARRILVRPGRD
jgi:peptidoglycan/xylan/chitin deacetylase (PgdA/CDA1 family)